MPYRQRNITAEQLEYGHDSNAYELAMYDANQDKPAQQESTSSPAPMPTEPDPAVQDYENNLYHRLDLTPPSETDGSAHGSDSGKQGSTGSSQAGDSADADQGKDGKGAQEVLSDIGVAQQSPDYSADIKFYLAAPHNSVLNEVRIMCQQETIPPALRDRPALLLRLCAEYGIDEKNDAEARDYLEHITDGSSSHQNTDDPLNAAWQETLTAYEKHKADTENDVAEAAYESELEAYKALVEHTYGVEFTDVKNRTSWDLLGIRMAHVAFEEMAKALSIAIRDYFGLHWDDATAFRQIIGKITLHNSTEPPKMETNEDGTETDTPKGIAQVRGTKIVVYWNEKDHRNYYLLPNVVLHELGHILNANGAFGVNRFKAWFNFLEDYPESRKGMGEPAYDVLIGKTVIYSYQSEIILPTLAQDIGIWDPDHVIFDHLRPEFPTQVQSLQQSPETDDSVANWVDVDGRNEVTADSIVNWVKHLITGGIFGFTNDEAGLNWKRIMGTHMDEVIRNAIAQNMLPNDGPIDVSHLSGYPRIYGLATVQAEVGLNARSTPVYLEDGSNIVTKLRDGQRLAILGRSEDGAWIASERYGVLVWAFRGTTNKPLLILPEDLKIENLPVYKDATLGLDP